MTTTLAAPGWDCPASGKGLSAAAQASLLAYLAGYVPGFNLTLPQGSKALQCVQQYVSHGCVSGLGIRDWQGEVDVWVVGYGGLNVGQWHEASSWGMCCVYVVLGNM
jgi:hypothetical protein